MLANQSALRKWARRLAHLTIGLAMLWLISLVSFCLLRSPKRAGFTVVAHRGGAAWAPENTMAAFESAIQKKSQMPIDYLETDVRMTQDGLLVLMHDSSAGRTTGTDQRIEEMSTSQFQALRSKSGSQPIPTLNQYLALSQHCGLLPEVKGTSTGLEEALVLAIEAAPNKKNIIVQSFSTPALEKVQRLDPDLPLCHLLYPWQLWTAQQPQGVKVIAPNGESLLLCPWEIELAHRQGYLVWPWFLGAENSLTVAALQRLGVDGMIVDNPSLITQ